MQTIVNVKNVFTSTRVIRCQPVLLLAAILFFSSSAIFQLRADEPKRKPDLKIWKTNFEQGQKTLKQKQFGEAEKYFRAALTEARNFNATDDRLADTLVGLGDVYANTGNLPEAEKVFREAAEIHRDDPTPGLEFSRLSDLALVNEKLGHYDEAEKSYQHMEDIVARRLGANHPLAVECKFQLAMAYYYQTDYAKAEPLLKSSLMLFKNPAQTTILRKNDPGHYLGMEVLRGVYRPNYAYALEAASHLAVADLRLNRLPEAEANFKDALAIADEYSGKDAPDLPSILGGIYAFYYSMTNYAAAEPVLERLIALQEKKLSPTDPAVMENEAKLAAVYEQDNKFNQAASAYLKLIELNEKISGPDSRDTANAIGNLARFYVARGKFAQAEPLYHRLFTQTEKSQGTSIALLPILNDQLKIYSQLGKDAELEATYQKLIAVIEKVFNASSSALIKPLNDYATLLHKEKRDAEATPLETRASAIQTAQPK